MTAIDTNRFRETLLAERERVAAAIDNLRNENPGSIEDETGEETHDQHLADTATAMHDRELDHTLADNEEQLLASIDAALQRIEDGTYGVCVNCGNPISPERLEARPWADLCIDCAHKLNR
jgi:DnaK suppressor protein